MAYLRLEVIGPRMVSVIGDIDLTGDDTEAHLAIRLRALEARISASPAVASAWRPATSVGNLGPDVDHRPRARGLIRTATRVLVTGGRDRGCGGCRGMR